MSLLHFPGTFSVPLLYLKDTTGSGIFQVADCMKMTPESWEQCEWTGAGRCDMINLLGGRKAACFFMGSGTFLARKKRRKKHFPAGDRRQGRSPGRRCPAETGEISWKRKLFAENSGNRKRGDPEMFPVKHFCETGKTEHYGSVGGYGAAPAFLHDNE